MMPISNEMKKDARAMLAWLETPAWSGLACSIGTRERETLETSARLYGIALGAQSIGKMLQQKMHVGGVVFQDVLNDLACLSPALSPEEQDVAGRLAAEVEKAKCLEGERQALQVVVSSERAKNESLTQIIAKLTELLADSGRRVGAAATEVTEVLDKRASRDIVQGQYDELKSILQPALDRSVEYTEWSAVSSSVIAELLVYWFGDQPLSESYLIKVLRDEAIHHYPETKTASLRTERRDQFIRHCKTLIDQHKQGAEAVRDL
ncbi:MAG: hypothetical protein WBH99_00825 [Azovibrio sp.]|uniref:hypothetical protein n=1 Tax=Azovibrio sp. TaxID=1872673 RepID=UPI003C70D515